MIRTVMDAKVAFETIFHIVTQDRRQQCYKYNELKVSIYACMYRYTRARVERESLRFVHSFQNEEKCT